jgi:predicted HicB family RNase H-like nuclease
MILKHEGFLAEVTYDDGDRLMHGCTINTRATLHFAGETVEDLKAAFADTIADYHEWCAERGVAPEKGYSGTLSLRLPPDLHKRVAEQAIQEGESLNQFIVRVLEAA